MSHELIASLAESLFAAPQFQILANRFSQREDAVAVAPHTIRPFLVAAVFALHASLYGARPMLVVTPGEEGARLFARDLASWLGAKAVLRYPLRREAPWGDKPVSVEELHMIGQRARALDALASGSARVVVASSSSLLRLLPPVPSALGPKAKGAPSAPLVLCAQDSGTCAPGAYIAGAPLSYDELPKCLVERGYTRLEALDGPGTFQLRGDTLAVHPAGLSHPVRVEFFGDEVELIRRVVPATGQTIGTLPSVSVYQARELLYGEKDVRRAERLIHSMTGEDAQRLPANVRHHLELLKGHVSFRAAERYLPYLFENAASPIDYADTSTLVVSIEPRALMDDAKHYYNEQLAAASYAHVSLEGIMLPPAQLDFKSLQRFTLLTFMTSGDAPHALIETKQLDTSSPEKLARAAHALMSGGNRCLFGAADRRVRATVQLALSDAHVPFVVVEGNGAVPDSTPSPSPSPSAALTVTDLDFLQSVAVPSAQLALLSLSDSGARRAAARGRAARGGSNARENVDPTTLSFPFKPGDYVVHDIHGIALFKAIVRQEVLGIERDYLHLEYAKGDRLFTPVEKIDRVTRYVGPESGAPRLTRLNTSDWSRALDKARKAARSLAFDLVDLYARRSVLDGFVYGPDDEMQREMESLFPYEETPDQLAAIADVKADMASRKPMDRLICGDVGFGKTEVALRATFKAAANGRQVMLLCPTTILAQQHYTTFSERFEPFGVSVDVLSRFRSAGEQRAIIKRFAEGTLDVLVGTHRLLSADVSPKDLGLVVIDEEQRFGVQHKEQLKNLREHIDILTLSATPIPRTMQMALSGVRDMSLIDTPPLSRTPIKVHVGEWDEDVVSTAIRREIQRGGQVYYVSNRVKGIDDAVARVVASAPEARVCVAHGKMTPTQLESVMERFAANEYDVLVATTIIESGLDNPHTNTLIIEDAQRLGLAQLYQLKGRVGRSHAQAYAFFLFPSAEQLTPDAAERLMAIDELRDLGSGTRVAMRDLEIRGAGSLLGADQHGMLAAVGFDLFASMLSEAVESARNDNEGDYGDKDARDPQSAGSGRDADNAAASAEVRIDMPVPFLLPEEYVPAVDERVLFYRRVAGAFNTEAVSRIEGQLVTAYGALPAPAKNLLARQRVRVLAEALGVKNVALVRKKVNLEPLELDARQVEQVKKEGGTYFVQSKKLLYPVAEGSNPLETAASLMASLLETA
ncbi:MAG: transcription-repair coupling factor [Coriobacteriales bacterium]|jgi:transcription-repair coupling factor (superfamily II helicase)|nr:transcription-repair coupling factor [Coriobacteriales bacterium]